MGLLVREQHYQQFLIYSSLYAFSIPEKTDDRNAEGNEEEYGKSLIDSKQR